MKKFNSEYAKMVVTNTFSKGMGALHFVTQSIADGVVNLEAEVISRSSEKYNNKFLIRANRRSTTRTNQNNIKKIVSERAAALKDLINQNSTENGEAHAV